jgi:hypothetical protein
MDCKPLLLLSGEIKTPPFSEEARRKAGFLLRMVQRRDEYEEEKTRGS